MVFNNSASNQIKSSTSSNSINNKNQAMHFARIGSIKQDPDAPNLSMIIQDEALLDEYRAPLLFSDSVELSLQENENATNQISAAMRNYVFLAIDWINSLFIMANNVSATEDKVSR